MFNRKEVSASSRVCPASSVTRCTMGCTLPQSTLSTATSTVSGTDVVRQWMCCKYIKTLWYIRFQIIILHACPRVLSKYSGLFHQDVHTWISFLLHGRFHFTYQYWRAEKGGAIDICLICPGNTRYTCIVYLEVGGERAEYSHLMGRRNTSHLIWHSVIIVTDYMIIVIVVVKYHYCIIERGLGRVALGAIGLMLLIGPWIYVCG